jgi:hypothetical protein
LTPRKRSGLLALHALLSGRADTLARTASFLAAAWRNRNLKTCALIFQEGPTERPDRTLDSCRDCPDATVRGGELVPICVADDGNPLRAGERARGSTDGPSDR